MKTAAAIAPLAYVSRPTARAANDNEPLIIDLFAGGGGASEAILHVTGRHPDIAVNHDPEAIALHAVNHPSTLHLQDDIRRVDIGETLLRFGYRQVGLLWASPDCKDHSKAKGGKPKDKNIRGLAWEVLRWAAAIKRFTGKLPSVIALENVEEFADWGPLHTQGKRAGTVQKKYRGKLFRMWVAQLRSLGFTAIEWKEIVAADFGAPTTRKRLFLVARSDGLPITWEKPTHARKPVVGDQSDLFAEPAQQPYSTAAQIIDWNLKIPSIFNRPRALKPKTRARIARGIKRYVIDAAVPFLVKVTHTKGGDVAYPLDGQVPTVTTAKGGEIAVTAPTIMPLTHQGQIDRSYSPEGQIPTVTGANRGELGLVSAHLGRQFGTTTGQDMREAHPTVMTGGGGGKSQLVGAHITRMAKGSTGSAMDDQVKTAATHAKDALVTPFMAQHNGDRVGRAADEPMTTLVHRGTQQQIVAPLIDKYYRTSAGSGMDEPTDTATATARFSLGAAFIEQANTGMVGHTPVKPLSTIVGKGCTQRLIEARLEEMGVDQDGTRAQVLDFLWEHFGAPTEEELADPVATARGRLRLGLVVLDSAVWQIVDIGMRMLTPRELYRAQGFSDDYKIDIDFNGKRLTKTAQIRMAGNSVSPPPAIAVLRANLPANMLDMRMAA